MGSQSRLSFQRHFRKLRLAQLEAPDARRAPTRRHVISAHPVHVPLDARRRGQQRKRPPHPPSPTHKHTHSPHSRPSWHYRALPALQAHPRRALRQDNFKPCTDVALPRWHLICSLCGKPSQVCLFANLLKKTSEREKKGEIKRLPLSLVVLVSVCRFLSSFHCVLSSDCGRSGN